MTLNSCSSCLCFRRAELTGVQQVCRRRLEWLHDGACMWHVVFAGPEEGLGVTFKVLPLVACIHHLGCRFHNLPEQCHPLGNMSWQGEVLGTVSIHLSMYVGVCAGSSVCGCLGGQRSTLGVFPLELSTLFSETGSHWNFTN